MCVCVCVCVIKIILTWPKTNLPMFHQTDLQDRTGGMGFMIDLALNDSKINYATKSNGH